MTSHPWDDDEYLLAELRHALRGPSQTTSEFVEAGRAAFTWRTIDAELALATMTYDSAVDDELLARARSHQSTRSLVFQTAELSVEIEVTDEGIAGQLIPPQRGQVYLHSTNGLVDRATTDEVGCFVLGAPPSGPVRLHCDTGETTVMTEWVCI